MSADTNLEILIQIREELAGLRRTQQGLRETAKEATSLGTILKQGLGIGSGIAMATTAVALLKNTLTATAGEAFRFAGEIKDQTEALGLTSKAYQALRLELMAAGVEASRLSMAISTQTQTMAEARDIGSSAATAYRTLGLSIAELERMPADRRLEMVARAALNAGDKTEAFAAAAQILGSRGLPQLLNALRGVATDGLDRVATSLERAGRIMDEDTAERLDRAMKTWEKVKNWSVIQSAGFLDAVLFPMENSVGAILARDRARQNAQPAATGTASSPRLALEQTTAWREKELALTRAQNREAEIQANGLESEYQQRRKLIGAVATQLQLEEDMLRMLRTTPLTPSENQADRDRKIAEAEGRVAQLQQKSLGLKTGPWRRADQAAFDYLRINDPGRAGYMTMGEGAMTGTLEFLTSIGSTGEQVANILNNSLGQAMNQLGSDIWEVAKGTQSWGDAFRNLGDIAGRMLTQIITQMLVVRAINAALGLFGYAMSGGGPTVTKVSNAGGGSTVVMGNQVTAAGGGAFLTQGPTQFTVGDNPGGVELVNVIPLSGIGQSTVNGQALRMAGGGSALVGGRAFGGGDTFNFSYSFNGGVSREEVLGLMPQIVESTKAAVLDAQRRRRDGFR